MMQQSAGRRHRRRRSSTGRRQDRNEEQAMMRPATRPSGSETGSDPYFQVTDVGPAKGAAVAQVERARRRYRQRVAMLGIVLAVVWIGVLLDPGIGTLVLSALAAFGAV